MIFVVEEKIKLIEDQFQKEKKENEDVIVKQRMEFENKLKDLESKMKRVSSFTDL